MGINIPPFLAYSTTLSFFTKIGGGEFLTAVDSDEQLKIEGLFMLCDHLQSIINSLSNIFIFFSL